jgi:hypothetical protein
MSEDRCIMDEMQQAKVDRGGSELLLEMQETVNAACRSTTAAGLGWTRRGLTSRTTTIRQTTEMETTPLLAEFSLTLNLHIFSVLFFL